MRKANKARINKRRVLGSHACKAVTERLERRQLMTVTPAIMIVGSGESLASNSTISNWPAGVALQLQTVRDISLSTGLPSDGSTFVSPSTPNNVHFSWNFGDTAMASEADYTAGLRQSQDVMTGFNAAHVYDSPGDYTVTLSCVDQVGNTTSTSITVDVTSSPGSTVSISPNITYSDAPTSFGPSTSSTTNTSDKILYVDDSTATINAEGNATVAGTSPVVTYGTGGTVTNGPLTSYAAAHNMLINNSNYASGAQVRFRAGDTFSITTINGNLSNNDLLIGSYDPNSPNGPLSGQAIFDGTGTQSQKAFITNTDVANITIQDITFENLAYALEPQGTNLTIRDCNFVDLANDIDTNTTGQSNLDGVLVQGCVDTTPASEHTGYVIYGESDDWVVIDNTFTGGESPSTGQPYLRWDGGPNLGRDISVEDNTVDDQYGYKNCDITIKGEFDFVYLASNTFLDGNVNIGNGGAFSTTTTSNPESTLEANPQDSDSYSDGVYTIYGPSANDLNPNVADINWAVMDSNRVVGDYLSGDGGDEHHFMVRNNVVERYSSEPTQNNTQTDGIVFDVSFTNNNATTESYGDLQLINNTVYDTHPGLSTAYDVDASFTGAIFVDNLAVDPNATTSAFPVAMQIGSTSDFSSVYGNDWFDPSSNGTYADDFMVGTDAEPFSSWHSVYTEDADNNSTISADSSYNTANGTLVASSNADVGIADDSASYDFYGNARPTSGTVVSGAVQQAPTTTLTLAPIQANDTIYLERDSNNIDLDIWQDIPITSSPSRQIPLSSISNVVINDGSDNEAVIVEWANGSPLPSAGLTVNGGSGVDGLQLVSGSSSFNTITSASGTLTVDSIPLSYYSLASLSYFPSTTGTDTLNVTGGSPSLTIPYGASTTQVNPETLATLNISAGASLIVESPTVHAGRTLLTVSNLSDAGTMNLGGNDMIVHSSSVATPTTADFTGGNGSASVDQFPGVAGSGWATAWSTTSYEDSNTATVTNNSPLTSGGGNYLYYSDDSEAANGLGGVARGYNTASGVNTGQPYTISFNYRLNSSTGSMTTSNDRIAIFGDTQAIYGTQSSNTWVIAAYGTTDGSLPALTWGFQNGDKNGDSNQTFVSTGVPLVQGTVYQFTVTVDPSTNTYVASVSNGGTGSGNSFVSGVLGFRAATAFTPSTTTYINITDRHGASGETDSWSLDSLTVAQTSTEALTALLGSGFNSGQWNGTGIDSSAAASDTTHLTALGVVENFSGGNILYTTFDGATVLPTDVLIKYTYYGDDNLNGMVDSTDQSLLNTGYDSQSGSNPVKGWYNGDFNYDGAINSSDYTLQDNAFNQQGPQL